MKKDVDIMKIYKYNLDKTIFVQQMKRSSDTKGITDYV